MGVRPKTFSNPDEVISFSDGISIATFQKNLQIFVDTLRSEIVIAKPILSSPPEPSSQIGPLQIQSSSNKGNETRLPHSEAENQ